MIANDLEEDMDDLVVNGNVDDHREPLDVDPYEPLDCEVCEGEQRASCVCNRRYNIVPEDEWFD